MLHDEPQSGRFAAILLDQQMWCFGRDIERADGNLLLRYGFERHRHPQKEDAKFSNRVSAYTWHGVDGEIILWGFGLFVGQSAVGGMFLRRFEFSPMWTPLPRLPVMAWEPADIPALHRPETGHEWHRAHHLVRAASFWLADYEQWVCDTVGIDYRRQCLRQWHKTVIPAETVPDEWRYIAEISCDIAAA